MGRFSYSLMFGIAVSGVLLIWQMMYELHKPWNNLVLPGEWFINGALHGLPGMAPAVGVVATYAINTFLYACVLYMVSWIKPTKFN